MSKPLGQRGDTIVEVLIAVVIVSAVLVASFAISNLSLKQIRMAQERSEAQKIAEQLVESLDRLVENDTSLTTITTPFCKNPSSFTRLAATDPVCTINGRYRTAVTRLGSAPSFGFAVTVTWDGLSGVQENLTVNYRVATE